MSRDPTQLCCLTKLKGLDFCSVVTYLCAQSKDLIFKIKEPYLEVSSLPVVLDEVRLLELDSSSVHQVRSPLLQFRIVVAGFHWNSIQGRVSQHPE